MRTNCVAESGCAICGEAAPLRPALRKNNIEIVRCSACGVGRALVPDFDPSVFYTEGYFTGEQDGAYVDYAGSEAVLRKEFASQAEFLRRFTPGGKLLEIGCAYGFFLHEAMKRRFDVYGVEIAQAAVNHCHATGLASVRQGALSRNYLEQNGPFDSIVMLDVIEHIDDVAGTIEMAVQHLKRDGVVMLTTGDWSSLFARVTGASWRLIAPPLHLWYFTPVGLKQVFGRFGCCLIDLSHPWKLVPLELVLDQAAMMAGLKPPRLPAPLRGLGLPANLFDAMRLVFRKK